jgi:hypothetical protein
VGDTGSAGEGAAMRRRRYDIPGEELRLDTLSAARRTRFEELRRRIATARRESASESALSELYGAVLRLARALLLITPDFAEYHWRGAVSFSGAVARNRVVGTEFFIHEESGQYTHVDGDTGETLPRLPSDVAEAAIIQHGDVAPELSLRELLEIYALTLRHERFPRALRQNHSIAREQALAAFMATAPGYSERLWRELVVRIAEPAISHGSMQASLAAAVVQTSQMRDGLAVDGLTFSAIGGIQDLSAEIRRLEGDQAASTLLLQLGVPLSPTPYGALLALTLSALRRGWEPAVNKLAASLLDRARDLSEKALAAPDFAAFSRAQFAAAPWAYAAENLFDILSAYERHTWDRARVPEPIADELTALTNQSTRRRAARSANAAEELRVRLSVAVTRAAITSYSDLLDDARRQIIRGQDADMKHEAERRAVDLVEAQLMFPRSKMADLLGPPP